MKPWGKKKFQVWIELFCKMNITTYDNLWISFTLFRRQENVEFKSDFQKFLPYYAYALVGLGNYKYWLIAWESDSNFASCLPINKFKIKV